MEEEDRGRRGGGGGGKKRGGGGGEEEEGERRGRRGGGRRGGGGERGRGGGKGGGGGSGGRGVSASEASDEVRGRALQRRQRKLDPRRLVLIDETSMSTLTITRLYGRAPQGERLVQKVLHGNRKTVTFIAALRHERVTAPSVLEGAMNGETFKAYVENSSLRH